MGARGFLVQRQMCATCIYRPESTLDLAALEAAVADPKCRGFFSSFRVCHHSEDACCAGFWTRHKDAFTGGQLAQRLGLVVFVDEDTLMEDQKMTQVRFGNETALACGCVVVPCGDVDPVRARVVASCAVTHSRRVGAIVDVERGEILAAQTAKDEH